MRMWLISFVLPRPVYSAKVSFFAAQLTIAFERTLGAVLYECSSSKNTTPVHQDWRSIYSFLSSEREKIRKYIELVFGSFLLKDPQPFVIRADEAPFSDNQMTQLPLFSHEKRVKTTGKAQR